MNRTPYVAEMFWNSDAGDLLSEVVHVKNDIARFGIAFQEFEGPFR